MNRGTIKDEYLDWCQNTIRFLNVFNEIPHRNQKYAKDDVRLELEERYQWLLDDIIHTYDHCRKILYRIDKIDKAVLAEKSRDEDLESLLDCYVRLYTLLDKVAKLIDYLFPGDGENKDLKFYAVAERLASNPNPYLRAIYHICTDIFPDRESEMKEITDPRSTIAGLFQMKGRTRNCIMHGTVRFCRDDADRGTYWDCATTTPAELFHNTSMLMYDVREIILNLQLAVERRKHE